MARAPDISSRIERIERALERALQLDEGIILDAGPMKDLMGFSWPVVRGWCDSIPELEKPGQFIRGGNGIKWQFHPVSFLSALLAHFRGEASRAGEKNRDLQRKVGVTLPSEEQTADLDDVRKLVALSIDVTDTKVRQNFYTPSEEVSEFVDGYNRAVVDGIMGVGSEVDPTGQLPAQVREKVNEALLAVATRVHGNAQKFIEERRARIQQTGVGSTG